LPVRSSIVFSCCDIPGRTSNRSSCSTMIRAANRSNSRSLFAGRCGHRCCR
jgi:hypothetical protein